MAALADLQPDRRAVLQLLVARGRGYDQIAELLNLPEIVVRRRAHDAITTLAGGPAGLDDARRALLCDYLVGELPASRRAEARTVLAEDPAARRFARSAAGRLSSLDGAQLPELPPADEEVVEALDALDARRERKEELATSSRKGAWLLIGAVAVAVIAIVVALSVAVGGEDEPTTNTGDTPTQTSGGEDDASRPQYAVSLTSPSGGRAAGDAALRESPEGPMNLAMSAENLTPTRQLEGGGFTAYAFWLDGPNVEPLRLGFFQPQEDENGVSASDGTLELAVRLDGSSTPAVDAKDLEKYSELFVTRETLESAEDRPESPGSVVLSGEIGTVTG
ncbi:MAG: hypothetical protein JHD16_14660 [Solirubrobacteraceae bacterium]|nr:hypothetical protein [Solirubrobacteraceae bacterium]